MGYNKWGNNKLYKKLCTGLSSNKSNIQYVQIKLNKNDNIDVKNDNINAIKIFSGENSSINHLRIESDGTLSANIIKEIMKTVAASDSPIRVLELPLNEKLLSESEAQLFADQRSKELQDELLLQIKTCILPNSLEILDKVGDVITSYTTGFELYNDSE